MNGDAPPHDAEARDPTDPPTETPRGPLGRLWLALPDWSYRALGAAFCFGLVLFRARDYIVQDFWDLGPFYRFGDGRQFHVPAVRVLIDATFLLMAISFCFRVPPKSRAVRGREILPALIGAFWPMIPLAIEPALGWVSSSWQDAYHKVLWEETLSFNRMILGTALVLAGHAFDVWGYATLFRSFSIVPEARVLKVTGPYRLVRHPVYLGHMMAQAGVWLFYAQTRAAWIAFYLVFVALQLYRSKMEDRVLERAFGETYAVWKRKTFWFV